MCGIFGWNGKHASSVSKDKLKLLGIYNDSRGGQSMGMYFNERVHKSINPHSKFKDYWEDNVFAETIEHNIVIGHSRRASVGSQSLANAQPSVITLATKKKDSDRMVLAHNGTIANYIELAELYGMNIKALNTDSQVMAALLLSDGSEVLSKYIGGASMLFTSTKNPEILYVFRGMSSMYAVGTHLTEERPLHYYQEHKNSIYFSSEKGALVAIAKDKALVKEVPGNELFKVENGRMTKIEDINRDDAAQKPNVVQAAHTVPNSGFTYGYKAKAAEKVLEVESDFLKSIQVLIEQNDVLYYSGGRFHVGLEEANGEYYVDGFGSTYTEQELFDNNSHPRDIMVLYFYKGFLLTDKSDYDGILLLEKDGTLANSLERELYRTICKYSPLPVGPADYKGEFFIYKESNYNAADSKLTPQFFSGSIKPLFTSLKYSFSFGDVTTIEDTEQPYYVQDIQDILEANEIAAAGDSMITPCALNKSLADKLLINFEQQVTISPKENKNTPVVVPPEDNPPEDIQQLLLDEENQALAEAELSMLEDIKQEILDFIASRTSDIDMTMIGDPSDIFIETLHDVATTITQHKF